MTTAKHGKTLVGLRPTEEDLKLIERLMKKLGVGESQVIRIGLRVLAEKEKLTA
jgi:hypothetical protein